MGHERIRSTDFSVKTFRAYGFLGIALNLGIFLKFGFRSDTQRDMHRKTYEPDRSATNDEKVNPGIQCPRNTGRGMFCIHPPAASMCRSSKFTVI